MSEVKDISPIEGSSFPSVEVLQRYLRGEASAEEKQQIESLLEDDPMMADAIEGLQMIDDPAVLQRSLHRIHGHTRQQLKRQISKRDALSRRQSRVQPRNFLPYIGTAAAAIALLFCTVYVVRQMGGKSDKMAQNQSVETQTLPAESEPITDADAYEPLELEGVYGNALASTDSADAESEASSDLDDSYFAKAEVSKDEAPPQRQVGNSRPAVEPSTTPNPAIASSSVPVVEEIADEAEPPVFEEDDFVVASPPPVRSTSEDKSVPQTSGSPEQEADRNDDAPRDYLFNTTDSTVEFFDEERLASIPEYESETRVGNVADSAQPRRKEKNRKQTSPGTPLYESAPKRTVEDIEQGQMERANAITDMIAKAVRHLEAKEYQDAIFQLDEVLLSEPNNVVAHHYRAQAYLAIGNDEGAITSLSTVVRLGTGENFEADQWALAQAYLRTDQKRKAKKVLKAIVEQAGTFATQAKEQLEGF